MPHQKAMTPEAAKERIRKYQTQGTPIDPQDIYLAERIDPDIRSKIKPDNAEIHAQNQEIYQELDTSDGENYQDNDFDSREIYSGSSLLDFFFSLKFLIFVCILFGIFGVAGNRTLSRREQRASLPVTPSEPIITPNSRPIGSCYMCKQKAPCQPVFYNYEPSMRRYVCNSCASNAKLQGLL